MQNMELRLIVPIDMKRKENDIFMNLKDRIARKILGMIYGTTEPPNRYVTSLDCYNCLHSHLFCKKKRELLQEEMEEIENLPDEFYLQVHCRQFVSKESLLVILTKGGN